MKRALGFVGLISVGLVLTGCDYNRSKPTSQFPSEQSFYVHDQSLMTSGTYPLSPFDKVVMSGPVTAAFKNNQAQDVIRVNGNPSSLNGLSVVQRGRIVYVSATAGHPVNIDVESQAAQSQIPLNLVLSGNTHTKMEGNFLIQRIDASGNANLKLYWLNTSHLTVNASGNAKLFLAGVVTHLDVTASGNSEVNGKYLRVDESYVLARDNAQVGVSVKKALGSQSVGNASIYYYRYPEFAGIYLGGSGSALNMKGISGPSNNLLD